jgi:mono/diheme cytochrome c family protein
MKVAVLAVAIVSAGAGLSPAARSQTASRSVKDGVYTSVQAIRGQALYTVKCASCHGSMASTTPDMAPLLNDHVFQATWKDLSVGDLFERILNTMPQNEAGTLSPPQTADIVAYILSANQWPAAQSPLGDGVDALRHIRMDASQP